MDAITEMGEEPYSCRKYAEQMSLQEAALTEKGALD
jgi:hypothetical protein